MDNRVLFMSNRVPFGITMKRLIFIAFSALFVAPATAATFGPLVSPTDLNAELDSAQPILLDIRGEAYEKEGHIVGAISAPYGIFRGPKENPGQLLEVATLEERYEALGLELERPVVIVPEGATDTDFGAAARVYWTLKSSGFSDLSILNGGVRSWVSAGLSLEKSASTLPATELDIEFSQAWTADTEVPKRWLPQHEVRLIHCCWTHVQTPSIKVRRRMMLPPSQAQFRVPAIKTTQHSSTRVRRPSSSPLMDHRCWRPWVSAMVRKSFRSAIPVGLSCHCHQQLTFLPMLLMEQRVR